MNPTEELRCLVAKLDRELGAIKDTPQNRLRISDRRRELVRALDLLHKLEERTSPTRKIRVGHGWPIEDHFNGRLEFPLPTDPDDFLGIAGEDLPLIGAAEVMDRLYRRCQED